MRHPKPWITDALLLLPLALPAMAAGERWCAPPLALRARAAWVDVTHAPSVDDLTTNDVSVFGLQASFSRAGYQSMVLRDYCSVALGKHDILAIVAPGREYSTAEVNSIVSFVEDGGTLVIAAGHEDLEACRGLISAFGLTVVPLPLGCLEGASCRYGTPRFHNANPIHTRADADSETLCTVGPYPVLVRVARGRGCTYLIADSHFFTNRNLEGKDEVVQENATFVERWFLDMGDGA